MEKYTVCLCGDCINKKDFLKHCQVIDNNCYIAINNELLPINFDEYIEHGEFFGAKFYQNSHCIMIDFENILKFNSFMADNKLFTVMDFCETQCDYRKVVTDYLKHITKNNIINHINYYLKNDYFDNIQWNYNLQKKIFKYSDVSIIRSFLKYIRIEYIDDYFFCSLFRNDDIILDYFVNKIGIYLTSYFTGKNYGGNMFKITNKDKLANIPNIYYTLCNIISYDRENKNIMEIYNQAINRFQELLESQENINVKKNLISEHNKLKLKLTYGEKIKNHSLFQILKYFNGEPSLIVKQLLMDGANIHTEFKTNFTLLDRSVKIIIKKKNLDLLDILFEMKLIDQSKLNLILKKSMGEIDFRNDTKLEINENFVRELSGYGADTDECFDKLIKMAKHYNNNKLVDYLKNLKNDLI